MSVRVAGFFLVGTLAFAESKRAVEFLQRGWFLAVGSATGSVTEYSISRKLGEPLRVERHTEPNRHNPAVSNEVVEMHYDGFDISLLKTPEKVFVTNVVITGPKVLVADNFRVGTSAARLKELGDGRMEGGRRCYHAEEGYDDRVCFTVSGGTIARVEWRYEDD